MKINNNPQDQKLLQAKNRVEKIKQFYKHIAVYLVINFAFISRRIYKDIMYNDNSIVEAFFDLSNYQFFFWWGVALMFHGIKVFGIPYLFSKEWEDKKIKEYMNHNRY